MAKQSHAADEKAVKAAIGVYNASRKAYNASLKALLLALGRLYHGYRTSANIDQESAGALVNPRIPQVEVSNIENGNPNDRITRDQVTALGKALGVKGNFAGLYGELWA